MERLKNFSDMEPDCTDPFNGINWDEFHKCIAESIRESRANQAKAWESAAHTYITC